MVQVIAANDIASACRNLKYAVAVGQFLNDRVNFVVLNDVVSVVPPGLDHGQLLPGGNACSTKYPRQGSVY